MARVLYVIWWEGIKQGGLIEHVVYRHLEAVAAEGGHQLTLLSGGPFWRGSLFRFLAARGWGRRLLGARTDNWTRPAALRTRFAGQGVVTHFAQTPWRPPHIYLRAWQLWLYPLPHLWRVHHLCCREEIEIVHCRSYFPAWICLLSRRLFRDRYRIIFDTRGLLPDEGVSTGAFPANGRDHRAWQSVERRLFRETDLVLNVSETFSEAVLPLRGERPMRTLYAPVDLDAFADPIPPSPPLPSDRRILVYLGAISHTSWHAVDALARAYRLYRRRFDRTALLVITREGHDDLRAALRSEGIDDSEILLRAGASLREVAGLLGAADCACLPFRAIRDESDRRIAATMISSKFTEYLAAGLPVICNRHIGGAARLIEAHQLGAVVDLDGETEDPARLPDPAADPGLRARCREAAALFSLKRIAGESCRVYGALSQSDMPPPPTQPGGPRP